MSENFIGSLLIYPTSLLGVYQNMLRNEFSVPQEITELFTNQISKMGAPRDRTIGMCLKKNATL